MQCVGMHVVGGRGFRRAQGEGVIKQRRLTSLGDKRRSKGVCEILQLSTDSRPVDPTDA